MQEKWISDPGKGDGWKEYALKVALCFPDQYSVGMSNLGFLWVYELLNRFQEVRCDRFFTADRQLNKRRGLLSVEAGRSLAEYDIVAFSLPYEGGYPAVPCMLIQGEIEPLSERRASGPLVLAGGVAASSNPEPISDFLDVVIVGEAEAVLEKFIRLCLETISGKKSGSRWARQVKDRASSIQGVYVPSHYIHESQNAELQAIVSKSNSSRMVQAVRSEPLTETAHSPVIASGTAFENMFLVEMTRGCAYRCRFCLAGHTGGPFRTAPDAPDVVRKGLAATGKIGLIGTAFTKSAAMGEVCSLVAEAGGSLSFSSVRLNAETMEVLSEYSGVLGMNSIAAAPEVATQRLSRVIGKDISSELEAFARDMPLPSLKKLRLYYLVGVPGERAEDMVAIAQTAADIHRKTGWEILVSVTPMVPKPHTPMQWAAMADAKDLKERRKALVKAIEDTDRVALKFESIAGTVEQAVLSRGDRSLGTALLKAAKAGRPGEWMRNYLASGGDTERFLKKKDFDSQLPWETISHGTSKENLFSQFEKSMQAAGEDS